jgi:hypothetical protein
LIGFARIGEQDIGAGNAKDCLDIFVRHVANLEDAGLRHLDQKHGFVFDLGGHGHGNHDIVNTIANSGCVVAQLDTDLRSFTLQEDSRCVRDLQRKIFDIDFFDAEYGLLVLLLLCCLLLFCHDDS